MIPTRFVTGLDNDDLKVTQAAARQVPEDFFVKKPFLGLICGQRGSGKTSALVNLIKHCDRYRVHDKIYLFCPTIHNDPKYSLLDDPNSHYVIKKFDSYSDALFEEVADEIRRDIQEYKDDQELVKAYKRFLRVGPHKLTPADLALIEPLLDANGDIQEPEPRFERPPTSICIFDDCVGNTELYKTQARGPFYQFSILHRHLLTSILFVTQTYAGAVPKQIRANLSLMLLFRLKPSIQETVADELFSSERNDLIVRMWDQACQEPFEFFLVNLDEPDKTKRYRRNCNEIFVVAGSKKNDRSPDQAIPGGATSGLSPHPPKHP
jgi:hypothetical protein